MLMMVVALLAFACSSSQPDVVAGDGGDGAAAESAAADTDDVVPLREFLVGTAWSVRSLGDEPLVVPATMTFSSTPPTGMILDGDGPFVVLTIRQGCEFPLVLFGSSDVFAVQAGPGDDCGGQTVMKALTSDNPSGEVRIALDGDLLILSTGSMTVTAEHFQSTSVQVDVPASAPTTTGSGGSTFDEPLVTVTAGPDVWINPEHALIEIPGGRWGDDPLLLTTSGASPGQSGFEASIAPETTESCDLLAEMLQGLERQAWVTARDEARGHDLDHVASDVGSQAEAIADALASLPRKCPEIVDRGERISLAPLDVGPYFDAMTMEFTDSGSTAWFASDYRNNVVTWLVVYETADDELTDSDLLDFARLVQMMFDRLASASTAGP